MDSQLPTTSMDEGTEEQNEGGEEMDDMLLNQDPAVRKIFQQLLMALNNEMPESLINGASEQSEDSDMSFTM
jgi:hypothetical protein